MTSFPGVRSRLTFSPDDYIASSETSKEVDITDLPLGCGSSTLEVRIVQKL